MKVTYDASVDAAFIYLSRAKSVYTVPVEWIDGMVNIDIASDWKLVWIEVIPASLLLDKTILVNAERH